MKQLNPVEICEKLSQIGGKILPRKKSHKVKIVLQNIKIAHSGKLYNFGDITIGLDFGPILADVKIVFLKSTKYQGTVHPHINGSSICFGGAIDAIKTMFYFDPANAVRQMHSILCNFGEKPYYNINIFDSELVLCSCCYQRKKDIVMIEEINYNYCSSCRKKYPYHPIFDLERCCKCASFAHSSYTTIKNKEIYCKDCL